MKIKAGRPKKEAEKRRNTYSWRCRKKHEAQLRELFNETRKKLEDEDDGN